jgi:hypothetical protein
MEKDTWIDWVFFGACFAVVYTITSRLLAWDVAAQTPTPKVEWMPRAVNINHLIGTNRVERIPEWIQIGLREDGVLMWRVKP